MMKGRIWLESEPGKGSTFFFTAIFPQQERAAPENRVADCTELPFRQPAASSSCATALNYTLAESAALALGAVKPRAKLAILLVDDNPLSRRMAQLVLEKEGHRVLPADGGAVALEMLECERIDLVLMDLQMPGMDGARTTQVIRHREKRSGRHLPIVALTADPLPGACEYCLQAGMDGYLIKPVQPALLRETIEGLKVVAAGQARVERDCSVVLDRPALLEQVNGDMQLLSEISDLFLHHCDKLMACALKTMVARDTKGFAHVLHTMLGMFRSLSALAAQETTERLQKLSIEAEANDAAALYRQLEKDVTELKTELVGLRNESCAGKPKARQFLPETTRRNSRASLLSPAIKKRPWHRVSRLRHAA
jgi:CheY-like chemotaxis protein